jgi:hypothetical protein
VAVIVRHFLDAVLTKPSTLPSAADLIKDVPAGSLDPVGLGK